MQGILKSYKQYMHFYVERHTDREIVGDMSFIFALVCQKAEETILCFLTFYLTHL